MLLLGLSLAATASSTGCLYEGKLTPLDGEVRSVSIILSAT